MDLRGINRRGGQRGMKRIISEYANAIKTMSEMCRDLSKNKSCLSCPFYIRNIGKCYFMSHVPFEYKEVIKEEHTVLYEINEENIKW